MRRLALVLALSVAFLWASTASAATVQQIIALSRAGVSDQVLLALIERDDASVSISSDDLVALKEAAVSESVVVALLKSGSQAAASSEPVPLPPPPALIIVGHGPERPHVSYAADTVFVPAFPFIVGPFAEAPRMAVRDRCVRAGEAARAEADERAAMLPPATGHLRPVTRMPRAAGCELSAGRPPVSR